MHCCWKSRRQQVLELTDPCQLFWYVVRVSPMNVFIHWAGKVTNMQIKGIKKEPHGFVLIRKPYYPWTTMNHVNIFSLNAKFKIILDEMQWYCTSIWTFVHSTLPTRLNQMYLSYLNHIESCEYIFIAPKSKKIFSVDSICVESGNHTIWNSSYQHIDGLVQKRRNSSALATELRLSCTNLSPVLLWYLHHGNVYDNFVYLFCYACKLLYF